jgi:hypothetical protein
VSFYAEDYGSAAHISPPEWRHTETHCKEGLLAGRLGGKGGGGAGLSLLHAAGWDCPIYSATLMGSIIPLLRLGFHPL